MIVSVVITSKSQLKPVTQTIRAALIAVIELVYEATAAGLTISVEKCRLGPATRVKYLCILR